MASVTMPRASVSAGLSSPTRDHNSSIWDGRSAIAARLPACACRRPRPPRPAPTRARGAGGPTTPGGVDSQLDAFVGLDRGHPHEPRRLLAVELARAHEHPGRLGQRRGEHPGSGPPLGRALRVGPRRHRHPQVEAARRQRAPRAPLPAGSRPGGPGAGGSARAAPTRGRRPPSATTAAACTGPGTMSPACLRSSARYSTSTGVAGVEPDPHPRQVRALRQRVQRQHPVGAVLDDARRRALPGELGVALVGEHRHVHAPGPTPRPRPGR